MPRNLKLTLAYDGTDFHGWQRQPVVRTVQQEVEQVAQRVLGHVVNVAGASRTDAGVHARGQVASMSTEHDWPLSGIQKAIAHRLPQDVALVDLAEAAPEFHASRDARGKIYRYRLHNAEVRPTATLSQRYAWHIWHPLDEERLRSAARLLVGTHDFAGFQGAGSPRQTTVRTIRAVSLARTGQEFHIDFEGDGFLYNQVRIMVGTLLEVGRGHWPPDRVTEILTHGERRLAGPTAPPHGLCLMQVKY